MKKLAILIILGFIFISIAYSQSDFEDVNGVQIKEIPYNQTQNVSAFGYVDVNPNGYLKYCYLFNFTNYTFDLLFTSINLNLSYPHLSASITPMKATNVFTESYNGKTYYCTKLDLDISAFNAPYPGWVMASLVKYPNGSEITGFIATNITLLLEGKYSAFINVNSNSNISFAWSNITDQDGRSINQFLYDTFGSTGVSKDVIVLELVNMSNKKPVSVKTVNGLSEPIYFNKPSDFSIGTYGLKYKFYANGLPVSLANCHSCAGKADGTKCIFDPNMAPTFGCISNDPSASGVCAGGICRPTCDPSQNYYNHSYNSYDKYFNNKCFSDTDGLNWYACCPNGNEFHVCVKDVANCPTYCGGFNQECCPSSLEGMPCENGLSCVCTASISNGNLVTGTKCADLNLGILDQNEIEPWNFLNFLKDGNMKHFIWGPWNGKYYSCCEPGSGCATDLPKLCQVVYG